MTKAFFCHTKGDKAVVKAVYAALVAKHPDVEPWLDVYEIAGGQDLHDKIAEGMDVADRFFVFLSPAALEAPWVDRELKRAMMQEVGGKKDFVVPVIIQAVAAVPNFLEHKLYIDLRDKTEGEAIAEIYAAVTGQARPPDVKTDNIRCSVRTGSKPGVVEVVFQAVAFAEPISFIVQTSAPIRARAFHWEPSQSFVMMALKDHESDFAYGVSMENLRLQAGGPVFIMEFTFDPDTDLSDVITGADRWTPQ